MPHTNDALFTAIIRLADNANILSHRFTEWCGNAPMLEEDIALANIGLDYLGQARVLYQYAATIEDNNRSEDDLAFLRKENEYQNLLLLELPNGDFANTMVRLYFFSSFYLLWWTRMQDCRDTQLAGLANKVVKELAYHVRHARDWLYRLGDGTGESRERCQQAIQLLWPYTYEMFDEDESEKTLFNDGQLISRSDLYTPWYNQVSDILQHATLSLPDDSGFRPSGGRKGRHTEHMGHILTEMQYLQRSYPGAQW